MMMINQSALATAVINITGNTQGLNQALGETKKQMHGFLVFAEAMGGKTGGFLANMLAMGGARAALSGMLGQRVGGAAAGVLDRFGLTQNPTQDVSDAMERARRQYRREVFAHKMSAANMHIGGQYQGQPINNRVDLTRARAQHGLAAPNMADITNRMVTGAAGASQAFALTLGRLGAIAAVAIPVFKKLVEAGTDLQNKMRRASNVFGASVGAAMNGFAGGFAGFGSNMSRSQFAAGAAGIGSDLAQRGVGPGRSASMASSLTAKAGDVAAAWGDDFENVIAKIQSAMSGSDGALKDFGVVLSDDLVRAKAFNSGMIKMGETMSAGIEAQARYELIVSQLDKSIKNSSSTFFSLSNQWNTTVSGFSTLMGNLGSALAPIAAGILGIVNVAGMLANMIATVPFQLAIKAYQYATGSTSDKSDDTDPMGRAKDDAARADEIIRTERQRQSSNVGFHSPENFYNHIQKSIFGNPTEILKRQTDLLHEFLLVSEEQLKVMTAFGYKVKNGSFLISN